MTDDKLNELLTGEEPEERVKGNKKFNPLFNVREEFALWVREEFPELKEYAKKRRVYRELEERKDEVYEAALGAVNHGVASTEACATSRLRYGWKDMEEGFGEKGKPRIRAKSLEKFVDALEDLSVSLGGDKHFTECGKSLSGIPYNSWNENSAFVYRVGDENSCNAEYLVFEEPQKFEEENMPVLIGELTGLTKWEYERLQKIASKFKGIETKFIDKADKAISGAYAYSQPSSYITRVSASPSGTTFEEYLEFD